MSSFGLGMTTIIHLPSHPVNRLRGRFSRPPEGRRPPANGRFGPRGRRDGTRGFPAESACVHRLSVGQCGHRDSLMVWGH